MESRRSKAVHQKWADRLSLDKSTILGVRQQTGNRLETRLENWKPLMCVITQFYKNQLSACLMTTIYIRSPRSSTLITQIKWWTMLINYLRQIKASFNMIYEIYLFKKPASLDLINFNQMIKSTEHIWREDLEFS